MVLRLRVLWEPERNWQGKQRSRHRGVGCLDLTLLKSAYLLFLKLLPFIYYFGTFKTQLKDNQRYLSVTCCLSEIELLSLIEWFNSLTTF